MLRWLASLTDSSPWVQLAVPVNSRHLWIATYSRPPMVCAQLRTYISEAEHKETLAASPLLELDARRKQLPRASNAITSRRHCNPTRCGSGCGTRATTGRCVSPDAYRAVLMREGRLRWRTRCHGLRESRPVSSGSARWRTAFGCTAMRNGFPASGPKPIRCFARPVTWVSIMWSSKTSATPASRPFLRGRFGTAVVAGRQRGRIHAIADSRALPQDRRVHPRYPAYGTARLRWRLCDQSLRHRRPGSRHSVPQGGQYLYCDTTTIHARALAWLDQVEAEDGGAT